MTVGCFWHSACDRPTAGLPELHHQTESHMRTCGMHAHQCTWQFCTGCCQCCGSRLHVVRSQCTDMHQSLAAASMQDGLCLESAAAAQQRVDFDNRALGLHIGVASSSHLANRVQLYGSDSALPWPPSVESMVPPAAEQHPACRLTS